MVERLAVAEVMAAEAVLGATGATGLVAAVETVARGVVAQRAVASVAAAEAEGEGARRSSVRSHSDRCRRGGRPAAP